MKILHIGTFPFPSPQGSQVYVQGILKGLVQRGHDVSLLCYGHGIGETTAGIRILRTPNISFYQNMRAGPDLIKPILDGLMVPLVLREKPDIIHVHNYEAPLVAKLANVFRRHKIPMVYSAHNTMEEELPTYFSGHRRKRMVAKFGRILDHYVPQLADHCVVLSQAGQESLERLGCNNISLIAPGVDRSEYLNIVPQQLPKGQWVIYAGNPDHYQDLDILMEAMKLLPTVGLVMVSASETSQWKRNDDGRILHIQTQNFREVCGYLQAAQIAVLPRVKCSGFPIKILNYLAMGLPVVCSEGSSIEAPSVFSVPNYAPQKMAEQIHRLLSDEERRVNLGILGREFVFTELSWEKQAERLESVYRGLIKT